MMSKETDALPARFRRGSHEGVYCKTCGIDIKLVNNTQSKIFNLENNILHCEECQPRKDSKYNQPLRRFWIKDDPQFSKLKRKGFTTNWRQK